jgi:hypothetical protein
VTSVSRMMSPMKNERDHRRDYRRYLKLTHRALSPVQIIKSISLAHSFLSHAKTRSTRSFDESQSLGS